MLRVSSYLTGLTIWTGPRRPEGSSSHLNLPCFSTLMLVCVNRSAWGNGSGRPKNRSENPRPVGTIVRLAAGTRAGNPLPLSALPLVLSVDLAAIHENLGNRKMSALVTEGKGRRDGEANRIQERRRNAIAGLTDTPLHGPSDGAARGQRRHPDREPPGWGGRTDGGVSRLFHASCRNRTALRVSARAAVSASGLSKVSSDSMSGRLGAVTIIAHGPSSPLLPTACRLRTVLATQDSASFTEYSSHYLC